MSEGPEIEQKRADLRAEKETLDGAMDIILNLERRGQAAAAASVSASSQYGTVSGFDDSQADSMATLDASGHRVGDQGTVCSATQFGDA